MTIPEILAFLDAELARYLVFPVRHARAWPAPIDYQGHSAYARLRICSHPSAWREDPPYLVDLVIREGLELNQVRLLARQAVQKLRALEALEDDVDEDSPDEERLALVA